MKLSYKIILLVAMLLGFLGGNAVLSWREVQRIHREFNGVVRHDMALMGAASLLNELQLKKEIIFEKLTSSSEELAFGVVNESRKQYLIEYLQGLQEQFLRYTDTVRQHITKVKDLSGPADPVAVLMVSASDAAALYDRKVMDIFTAVSTAGYSISLEEIDRVQLAQAASSKALKVVLDEISAKVEGSAKLIDERQQRAQKTLLVSLLLSVITAFVLTLAILYRIHTAFKMLVAGVRALDQGKLGTQIAVRSTDEIGQLAGAFNQMSAQLERYHQQMQEQNQELAGSLKTAQQQKRELERINRDLDRFVHLIGHDVKGPLTSILFYSDYLKKHPGDLDAKARQAVEGLAKTSARLSAMMHDLLEMTKITRVKRPFELVDIGYLIKDVLDRQEDVIQRTSSKIRVMEGFPKIMGDKVKLTVVFFNLIGNAVKYSCGEGKTPQVDIRWKKTLNEYVFSVKDNGIGIPSEHYQDVFEIFRRLAQTEHIEGTGVGLAMVRDIVQEHGGKIWVESVGGAGSEFFFSIPLESTGHLG